MTVAEYDYGVLCWNGKCRPQDRAESVQWFHRAAAKGDVQAMHNLGHAYWNGWDNERKTSNQTKGDHWMRKTAEKGLAESQAEMGRRCYNAGELEEARRWLELASEQKHLEAHYNLALLMENGLGGPRMLDQARSLYLSAAMQEHDKGRLSPLCLKQSAT